MTHCDNTFKFNAGGREGQMSGRREERREKEAIGK